MVTNSVDPQLQLQKLISDIGEHFRAEKFEAAYAKASQANRLVEYWILRPSKELLFMMAKTCQKTGRFRKSIEYYREVLKLAHSPYERAEIYLELCRNYRALVQMKNARLEIQRAFKSLNEAYPRPSLFLLLQSLFAFIWSFLTSRKMPLLKQNERLELLISLYEEAGLSAYYLREFSPMAQCVFRVRVLCYKLGPGPGYVDWMGGTGVVFALFGMHKMSDQCVVKMQNAASALKQVEIHIKAKIWHALICNYKGQPVESAKLFEKVLEESPARFAPRELHLACSTLACNFLLRGYARKAESVLQVMLERIDHDVKNEIDWSGRLAFQWYVLPGFVLTGQMNRTQETLARSKAILSSSDDEKWQIAQYLGNVLFYYYLTGETAVSAVDDAISRYDELRMPPHITHLEACHYWVAKAYVRWQQCLKNQVTIKIFENALCELGRVPEHPNLQAHFYFLKAQYCEMKNADSSAEKYYEKAKRLADDHDCPWVSYNILKFSSPSDEVQLKKLKDKMGWA